jgi:two-component system chemotaxis response regulator CheB
VAENKALLEPHYIDLERMSEMAKPSSLTCPECGGTLWWTQGAMPPHYRCHTGHAFSPESLNAATDSVIERSVWEAVRALHEKKVQSKLRAAYHMRLGETDDAERCLTEARNAADSARWLQRLLRGED